MFASTYYIKIQWFRKIAILVVSFDHVQGRFSFFCCFWWRRMPAITYQKLFSELENIVPCQSYCILKSQKYIQLHCACELQSRIFEVDPWNLEVMFYLSRFYKLGSKVKISNFEISNSSFLTNFGRVDIFKIRYFHFWGLNQKSAYRILVLTPLKT